MKVEPLSPVRQMANPLTDLLMREFTPNLATICDYVAHFAQTKPDDEAAVDDQNRITWKALEDAASSYASALIARGIKPGDRVAMLTHPNVPFLACLLGVLRAGAIWVGLNPKYTRSELEYVLEKAEPKIVLGTRALDPAGTLGAGAIYLDDLAHRETFFKESAEDQWLELDPEAPALMVFTSGSSGAPKAALLAQKGLVQAAQKRVTAWQHQGWRTLMNLPINHIGGVGDLCCTTLIAGGMLAFMERFDALGSLQVIERERLTLWFQVPTQMQLSLSQPSADTYDLSSLKAVIWSGAPAPRALVEDLAQRFPGKLGTDYSMTESIGAVSLTPLMDDVETLTKTVGWPVPGRAFNLRDGEITIKDDAMFAGYLGLSADETFEADGAFRTGDLGEIDSQGRLRITGRAKDMFKSGGYNVYPREVETALEAHDGVAMAAVIAMPDPIYNEVGHAFVLPNPNDSLSAADLDAFVRERLANYKVPKKITISSDLPLLPIGKIDKKALKRAEDIS